MKTLTLINEKSGGVQNVGVAAIADIARGAAAAHGDIDMTIVEGDASALIEAAQAHSAYDVIATAGGDGTQAAIAGALLGTDTAMLPLPCGTVNMFCRDLGIPIDIEDAFKACLDGEPTTIDAGVVDGRVFLNNVVFGAYADLAEAREELRDAETLEDVSFGIVAAADAIVHADPVRFQVVTDGKTINIETNTIAVSNNEISHAEELIPQRRSLSSGKLFAYLADASDGGAFAALLADFARGAAKTSDAIRVVTADTCLISARGAQFSYTIDGDPVETCEQVALEIRPQALTVMKPRATA